MDKSGDTFEFDAVKKSLSVKVGGDCTIEAQGKVALKSLEDDLVIECKNFSVKAKASCKLEANSDVSIDGMQVALNGTALVVMK